MPYRSPRFDPFEDNRPRPKHDPKRKECKAAYKVEKWRKVRAAFLAEHPLCGACEAKGLLTLATLVHHHQERLEAPELTYEWSNLRALCSPCHTQIHNERRKNR